MDLPRARSRVWLADNPGDRLVEKRGYVGPEQEGLDRSHSQDEPWR